MQSGSVQDGLVITTERVDDIPLLIGVMQQMGLPQILDRHIPYHWKQRELSWGCTAVIWLAYILTEGDHRKSSVEAYIKGMKHTLKEVLGQAVSEADFTTDRLAHVLKYLSQASSWKAIEQELSERSIEVYDLPTELARCDATTVSGYHEGGEESLFQFGHSKDDPKLRQLKLMVGSLDPLGMPLVSEVVSGERADDGLYVPVIDRMHQILKKRDVLFCGDCKMSALAIRLHLKGLGNHYLSPLPRTGKTAAAMDAWIQEGLAQEARGELQEVTRKNEKQEVVLIARGYEFERAQSAMEGEKEREWTERVLMVQSPTVAEQQKKGLDQRVENARQKIGALTPPRGRGQRQITEEKVLKEAIDKMLKAHNVEDLLEVKYEKEVENQVKYIGRGRGAKHRSKRVIQTIRYQITQVTPREEKMEAKKNRLGWKAYVTDVSEERLSLKEAVLCYRKEYRVERIFNRLKSHLKIAPFFVKREDQVAGLTHLLTLGVRVLTLMEFVVRRSLQQDPASLAGLHPENPKKTTDAPTAERILKAFSNVNLTLIHSEKSLLRHLTPLSELQKQILKRLGLEGGLYSNLEINNNEILLAN